jgi:hypothetical protein
MNFRTLGWRLHDLKWWILHRFHPSHRYHIIHSGLRPGWYDRDLMMAVIIKKIIIDFIEQEEPYNHWDTKNSNYAEDWVRLRELYNYFKTTDLELSNKESYDLINEKLIEAVRLRHLLWT